MDTNLEARELQLLVEVVEGRLSEWRQQIYHAEDPRFRDDMKAEEVVLNGLLEKLRAASRSAAA